MIVRPIENRALRDVVTPIFESLGHAMAAVADRYSARELDLIRDYFETNIRTLRDETAKVFGRGGTGSAGH